MQNEPITLRDIAQRVNMSTASVSRALAGQTGVGARRAAHIQQIAAELGYRPRPLRRNRAQAIAVLVGTDQPGYPDEDFSQRLVILAARAIGDLGLHVHLEFVSRQDNGKALPVVLRENRVDGVLLAGHPSGDLLKFVEDHDIPAVVLGGSCEWVARPCVNPDPSAAVREAIDRLIGHGHRRIGLAISDRKYPVTERLYQVCRGTLAERGLDLPDTHVVDGLTPDLVGGQIAIQRFLDAGGSIPTGVLFTNDWMALGGLCALVERGYRVGEDVSIIGQDNLPWTNQTQPALSSIDHHEAGMLGAAVRSLKEQIEGRFAEPEDITVTSRLVWRRSCGPAPRGPS